ncbi:MAG: PilZ domain-containing protein [Candidatus Omnitrophica bacterium]|nr:PilZ domain-containing protein [Candidatus Omnitrophota bacterium]MCG2703743.1 PilZ domain-containing protein [Candidatus Omnitrophota bacterium]
MEIKTQELRRYIRLNKIFPVELNIVDFQNKLLGELIQGFTRDVSFEGVCVEINNFPDEYLEILQKNQDRLVLYINIPFARHPVKAVARVVWKKKAAQPYLRRYFFGMSYEIIDKSEQRRIIRYAKISRAVPVVIGGCLALLILLSLCLVIKNNCLNRDNNLLVYRLIEISAERTRIRRHLDKIETEKNIYAEIMRSRAGEQERIKQELLEIEVRRLEEEGSRNLEAAQRLMEKAQLLEQRLDVLAKEKAMLEEKLKWYTQNQENLQVRLEEIGQENMRLEDKSLALMRQWLFQAQSSKTGLVVSYDDDSALMDVGFTYDQALSAFNFINCREYSRAKRIFDFFLHAEKINGGFANAYDVISGKTAEYIVHSGPSIYLGLAMMRYEDVSGDDSYRVLVKDIGEWLLSVKNGSEDGSLPGGPQFNWTSTEQNVAASVFFRRLFAKTHEQRYLRAEQEILAWIKNKGYNGKLKRFNRGNDDIMIATDTMALSIMAFGPDKLNDMGIEIESLVKAVEDNCKISVFLPAGGGRKMNVTGFDFCCPSSVGRAGTISVEWTAQMIVAFHELSRYYLDNKDEQQAQYYQRKADYYLGELEKLLLVRSALGRKKGSGGFPYATDSGVTTGHGWYTPNRSSISAAGTNFAIFAKEEYNIFKI